MPTIFRPLLLTAVVLALSGCVAAPLAQLAVSAARPNCTPSGTQGSTPGCDTSSLGLLTQGLQETAQKLAAQMPKLGQPASPGK